MNKADILTIEKHLNDFGYNIHVIDVIIKYNTIFYMIVYVDQSSMKYMDCNGNIPDKYIHMLWIDKNDVDNSIRMAKLNDILEVK